MSGRQVLVSAEVLERLVMLFPANMRGGELGGFAPDVARAVEAARLALTTPPTSPDKPEPGQEGLVGLARSWEGEAILLYAQETSIERDGSAAWHDSKCRAEHDTLRQCVAELLARLSQKDPTP